VSFEDWISTFSIVDDFIFQDGFTWVTWLLLFQFISAHSFSSPYALKLTRKWSQVLDPDELTKERSLSVEDVSHDLSPSRQSRRDVEFNDKEYVSEDFNKKVEKSPKKRKTSRARKGIVIG